MTSTIHGAGRLDDDRRGNLHLPGNTKMMCVDATPGPSKNEHPKASVLVVSVHREHVLRDEESEPCFGNFCQAVNRENGPTWFQLHAYHRTRSALKVKL